MPQVITAWSCVAECSGGTNREVVGFYQDEKLILVSRPWIAMANPSLHAMTGGRTRTVPLLGLLMTVCDYHLFEDMWYGEIATSWLMLVTLFRAHRTSINESLRSLMSAGYIQYDPAAGRVSPALIRLYPHNHLTGDRVIQVEPSWLRDHLAKVTPIAPLYQVVAHGQNTKFERLAPETRLFDMVAVVGNAPIFVPGKESIQKSNPTVLEYTGKNLELFNLIRDCGAYEDTVNVALGLDPFHSAVKTDCNDLAQAAQDQQSISTGWTQNDQTVQVRAKDPAPEVGQAGVAALPPADDLPRGYNGLIDIYAVLISRESRCERHLNPGAAPTAAPQAPASPPPAAPPVATARWVRPRSERQLQPGQVEEVLRLRGQRLSHSARIALPTVQLSCVDAYERLSGVPFCVGDLPHLMRAVEITSHRIILECIRDCSSKWPKENPGYYVVRDGMAHVLRSIESSREKKGCRRRKKVSGLSLSDDQVRDMVEGRRARAARRASGAPATSVQEPAPAPQVKGGDQ